MDFDRQEILSTFVAECHDGLDLMEQSLLAMESGTDAPDLLQEVFRVAHTIKGNATSLEFEELAGFAHAIEDQLDLLREHNSAISTGAISLLLNAVDELRALVKIAETGTPRLTAEQQKLKEQIAREVAFSFHAAAASAHEKTGTTPETTLSTTLAGATSGRTIRASISKLDRMLNLTSEIVIVQGRMRRLIESLEPQRGREMTEIQSESERLFRDLQDEVMAVRMVPIGSALRQATRTVRDLANSHSKLARVEITGGDVEVDTAVVEHLKDALLHMIRNAIDHGIEIPPIRKQRGKDPCGVIRISAAQVGGLVVVTLEDDGAGLNPAKILAKARQMGLFLHSVPSDSELYRVLFMPGFSTANSVTDLSGRGVGLDVVKRNIEAMHGSVEIASQQGDGTTVTISLPLTLAIIDGFSVRAGDDTYIVPQEYVIECTELTASHPQSGTSGVLNLRGSALPYIRLRDVFGYNGRIAGRENVVIVKVGNFNAGIAVDQLLGGMQAVIKPLGKVFRNISGVAGATILGDGKVGLIIDVPGLLQGMMQSSFQPQAG